MGTVEVWTGLSESEAEQPQGGGVCGSAFRGPGGEEENLDTGQVHVRVCARLLARARRFELTVVKAKVPCGYSRTAMARAPVRGRSFCASPCFGVEATTTANPNWLSARKFPPLHPSANSGPSIALNHSHRRVPELHRSLRESADANGAKFCLILIAALLEAPTEQKSYARMPLCFPGTRLPRSEPAPWCCGALRWFALSCDLLKPHSALADGMAGTI